jgi:hypothetical protein
MFFCEKVKKEDIEIHFLRKVKGTNFTKTKIKIMFIVLENFFGVPHLVTFISVILIVQCISLASLTSIQYTAGFEPTTSWM